MFPNSFYGPAPWWFCDTKPSAVRLSVNTKMAQKNSQYWTYIHQVFRNRIIWMPMLLQCRMYQQASVCYNVCHKNWIMLKYVITLFTSGWADVKWPKKQRSTNTGFPTNHFCFSLILEFLEHISIMIKASGLCCPGSPPAQPLKETFCRD